MQIYINVHIKQVYLSFCKIHIKKISKFDEKKAE